MLVVVDFFLKKDLHFVFALSDLSHNKVMPPEKRKRLSIDLIANPMIAKVIDGARKRMKKSTGVVPGDTAITLAAFSLYGKSIGVLRHRPD